MIEIEKNILALMRKNERHSGEYRYTVPSPELYPFQWLWDSCFHAIILSYYDLEAAKDEIRSVLSHPLENGLLPHIIFWKDDYLKTNWGRERRGDIINNAWSTAGNSSITQPPIIAEAVRLIMKKSCDMKFAREVYPKLASYYRALLRERDIGQTHLLGIVNPDESGEDNSPRFDDSVDLPIDHSDDEHLDRRINLIEKNVACDFDEVCMQQYFWVEDVPFNAIAIVGLNALSDIALSLKKNDDAIFFRKAAHHIRVSMRTYLLKDGLFLSQSFKNGKRKSILIHTWALYIPLYAGLLTRKEATATVEDYLTDESTFWTPYPVPSVSCREPSFRRNGFWRGPTWMVVNWFVYHGLVRYGFTEVANELKHRSHVLISKSGFREQYDPITGDGLGAHSFTWGGLFIDMEQRPHQEIINEYV